MLSVLVSPQIHLPLERLVAELAGERLVSGVLAHVGDQVARLAERFQAYPALVRFFPCDEKIKGLTGGFKRYVLRVFGKKINYLTITYSLYFTKPQSIKSSFGD